MVVPELVNSTSQPSLANKDGSYHFAHKWGFEVVSYCCSIKLLQIQLLKQHKFIVLQFRGLEVWHRSYWAKIKVLGELHSGGS